MNPIKTFLLAFLFCTSTITFAQLQLPAFFGDHMVLQQKDKVSIWGSDKPNTKIKITGSWGKESTAVADNKGQWSLKLSTPSYGGPYTLTLNGSTTVTLNNVLIGEVWLCSGQSNMEMPVKGYNNQPIAGSEEAIINSKNNQIRLFTVKKAASMDPLNNVEGQWAEASPVTVRDFSATAYFFGKKLNTLLNVPIGLIHTSWGGSSVETWMEKEAFSNYNTIELPKKLPEGAPQRTPTLLYNAMINPLVGYNIKGAIWYQGESNRNRAEEYSQLFPTMIKTWREKWQQGDFPFYFVQIAPYGYSDGNVGYLREAQLHTMKTVENTGMAVTMDIGDCDYIHPREKNLVGDRLALWALTKDYGMEGIAYSGPVFKEIEEIKDGKVRLSFDYSENGLSSYGQGLSGFEIAGTDKVFHPAEANINSDKSLSVYSKLVPSPVAVRYAFKNCEAGSLFNTAGLPASSFRTDTWEE